MSLFAGCSTTLRKVFGISCLFAVQTLAANLSTSVGFPSAPESRGCSKSRTDNLTAVCSASLNGTQATALASVYQTGANSYVVLGTIHVTRPDSSPTVRASLSATLTEFSEQITGGVHLTSNCTADCEPISVTVNGTQVGVLSDDQRSLDIPYAQQPLVIQLSAEEAAYNSGTDYVGMFNITATSF